MNSSKQQHVDDTSSGLTAFLAIVGWVCLFVLHTLGGVISGIWLASVGKWDVVFVGILCTVLFPWILAIAAMPAYGLSILFDRDKNTSQLKIAVFGFSTALWNAVLVVSWAYTIFWNFAQCVEPGLAFPLLLWGYVVTRRPLATALKGELEIAKANRDEEIPHGAVSVLWLAMLSNVTLSFLFLLGAGEQTMIISLAILATIESLITTAIVLLKTTRGRQFAGGTGWRSLPV